MIGANPGAGGERDATPLNRSSQARSVRAGRSLQRPKGFRFVSTDVAAVLAAIRETAEGQLTADAARVDRERSFPRENLRTLGEVGGLGLVVPAEHGGAGGSLTALA